MISIWGRNITYEIYFPLRVFYVANIFTIPITIFAGYLIWTKTPPEMRNYKWILLHIWGWTTGADIMLTLALELQLFFPLFGGTTSSALLTWLMPPLPDCGYFAWVSRALHSFLQFLMLKFSMMLMFILVNTSLSLLDAFLYRLIVLDSVGVLDRRKKFLTAIGIVMHFGNSILIMTFAFLAYSPRTKMEAFIRERFPEFSDIITLSNYVILEPELNPYNAHVFWSASSGTFVVFAIVAWVIHRIFQVLARHKSAMSEKTYEMHKMLVRSLIIQVAIPSFLFYFPTFLGMGYLLLKRVEMTGLTLISHIFLGLFCLHTFLNIVSMIWMIKPYRIEALRLLEKTRLVSPKYREGLVNVLAKQGNTMGSSSAY